jgi:hypothetical protein
LRLAPVALQQDHHDRTGQHKLFFFFGEVAAFLDGELALEDGAFLLDSQHGLTAHVH